MTYISKHKGMEHTLAQFAAALRMMGVVTASISYGSGGYCVVLKNRLNDDFSGYSWDIDKAFEVAKDHFREHEKDNWDEDTHVDYKAPKDIKS
jgi:hypothetical protein